MTDSGRTSRASGPSSLPCMELWDYSMELECLQASDGMRSLLDLQLAAELGKTLLERNKELETSLKQHQNIIEDQTQEIEYLTKQTAALREVNDSRLRIYEQLEVSIQDLERTNQRLAVENTADKKHIKSLCLTIDSLEAKCEELQRSIDDLSEQQENRKRIQGNESSMIIRTSDSTIQNNTESEKNTLKLNGVDANSNSDADEVVRLLGQIRELKHQRAKEQRKAAELEEQLAAIVQENMTLEEKLNIMQQKEDDMKCLQEEMLTLEEVRQGQLCRRCLRAIDTRGQDELSLVMDREDDDISVVNSVTSETHCSTVMMQIQNIEEHHDNPYRILVEKYEALLEMQRHPVSRQHSAATSNNCLSLQEELQLSGDFGSFTGKEDPESEPEPEPSETCKPNKNRKDMKSSAGNGEKAFSSTTPTDFSEAETSSSGFSDETSNKGTQTEGHLLPPGSFLCSIADGDDCRFSIYDDASPIESRFRKTPEYRQLFREIFAVLKRAAEAKDEGEQLPLLEDSTPVIEVPKVPPATPLKEEQPSTFTPESTAPEKKKENGRKSSPESKKQKVPPQRAAPSKPKPEISEPVEKTNELPPKNDAVEEITSQEEERVEEMKSKQAPKKDYLEYLSVGVGVKKKSNRGKNSPMKNLKASVQERVQRLEQLNSVGIGMSFTNRTYKKRRDGRHMDYSFDRSSSPSLSGPNGTYRNDENQRQSPYSCSSNYENSWEVQSYPSAASQEVAKLKRLEKSYAEVLRYGPQKTNRPHYRK
ncbi:hypothetical protein R5R35_012873 [Gryllus longicercus]